jgi:hypothetical protein
VLRVALDFMGKVGGCPGFHGQGGWSGASLATRPLVKALQLLTVDCLGR